MTVRLNLFNRRIDKLPTNALKYRDFAASAAQYSNKVVEVTSILLLEVQLAQHSLKKRKRR